MSRSSEKFVRGLPAGLITSLGGLALFGWGLGWAGLPDASGWAIGGAFVISILTLLVFGVIGESVIEDGIKLVIVVVLYFSVGTVADDIPWVVTLVAGLVAGATGALVTNLTRGAAPARATESARQLTKAERRKRDDAERRKTNERDRGKYEAEKTARENEDPVGG